MQGPCAYTVICGLSGSTIFSHIIGIIFGKNVHLTCVFSFFLQLVAEIFLFYEELSKILTQMYIVLHVKYPSFLSDLSGTSIFTQYFRKFL